MTDHDPGDECAIGEEVPAAMEDIPCPADAMWFGCWLEAGHYLHGRRGRIAYSHVLADAHWLDGGFAPRINASGQIGYTVGAHPTDRDARLRYSHRSEECPQGQFLHHQITTRDREVYSLISWWDRTQGDSRGACNSTFIVPGRHDSAQLMLWLPQAFPRQVERLAQAGVTLVEVFCAPRTPER